MSTGTEVQKADSNRNISTNIQAGVSLIGAGELVARQRGIVDAMHAVMQEGTHYGPPYGGSDKNVLLKAGAEVLGVLFQLAPSYEIAETKLDGNHREYKVICELTHIPTGRVVGEGMGLCTSMESKYRYRNVDEATEVPVPSAAWDAKQAEDYGKMREILRAELDKNDIDYGDNRVGFTKSDNGWVVSIQGKEENQNIADTFNTILKMAKKRAHVDAILAATGASNLFTQDVEEFDGYDMRKESTAAPSPPKAADATPEQLMKITELAKDLPDERQAKLAKAVKDGKIDKADQAAKVINAAKNYIYARDIVMDTDRQVEGGIDNDYYDRLESAEKLSETQEIINDVTTLRLEHGLPPSL